MDLAVGRVKAAEQAHAGSTRPTHLIVPTLRVGMQLQTLCVCGTRSVPG